MSKLRGGLTIAIGLSVWGSGAGAASAQDVDSAGHAYVSIQAGAVFVEDTEIEANGLDPFSIADHDTGFAVGGMLGYDFGRFRLEGEVTHRESDTPMVTILVPSPTEITTGGQIDITSFMANGLFDLGADGGLQGALGAGIGFSDFDNFATVDTPGGPVAIIDDGDSPFTWQLLAEARYPVAPRWDIGARYSFTQMKIEQQDTMGVDVAFTDRFHTIAATLTYRFGAG